MLDLDPYYGTDPLGMFPLFLQRPADVIAPRLSVVLRRLVRLGSFEAYLRTLSGRIGKMLASRADVARSIPG